MFINMNDNVTISRAEYEALERLKHAKLVETIINVQKELLQFYPANTRITITKDYFVVEK